LPINVKKDDCISNNGYPQFEVEKQEKLLTPKSLSGYHKTGGVTNE